MWVFICAHKILPGLEHLSRFEKRWARRRLQAKEKRWMGYFFIFFTTSLITHQVPFSPYIFQLPFFTILFCKYRHKNAYFYTWRKKKKWGSYSWEYTRIVSTYLIFFSSFFFFLNIWVSLTCSAHAVVSPGHNQIAPKVGVDWLCLTFRLLFLKTVWQKKE